MIKASSITVLYRHGLLVLAGLGGMACQQASPNASPVPSDSVVATQEIRDMSDQEKAIVAKLEWVRSANAKEDAHHTLARKGAKTLTKDGELIAFSGRRKSFPGLTAEQYAQIEARVTYRLAEGTGDVLYGPTHKALRKELLAYASEYNKIIYDALTETP